MKKIRVGCAAVLMMAFAGMATALQSDINNSTWHVKQKGKAETMDTLVFINGQFTSTECVPFGFYTGPYTAKEKGTGIEWTATQMNAQHETMDWKGQVEGAQMTGSYTYKDKTGKASTTQWNAERAQPHKA